jgi:hypothetical protein
MSSPQISAATQNNADRLHLGGLFDAALEISKNRCALLDALRTALDNGDERTALQLARRLVGTARRDSSCRHT